MGLFGSFVDVMRSIKGNYALSNTHFVASFLSGLTLAAKKRSNEDVTSS